MESFMELALRRQSCRKYTGRPVETERLKACVEAARQAPSACNGLPWRFVIVNGGETARALARCTQGQGMNRTISTSPAFIVVCQAKSNLSSRAGGLLKGQDYAGVDIGLAAAHLCFEAADQGLGTCLLGWFDERKVKKLLGIPRGQRVRLLVAVGYPENPRIHRKRRKAFDEICRIAGEAGPLPDGPDRPSAEETAGKEEGHAVESDAGEAGRP